MTFKSQLFKIYQTDSNAIFSIMFTGLIYIITSKPISNLRDISRRNNWQKKDGILRLSADLAFLITRTKCMQSKNELNICGIALQRIALLKVYKNPGPNPSGIRDLRQCSDFEAQKRVQKQLKFESQKE